MTYPKAFRGITVLIFSACLVCGCQRPGNPYPLIMEELSHPLKDSLLADSLHLTDTLSYHRVRIDPQGGILPWYAANPGISYDRVIRLVWDFWKNMETDSNGLKYYMNHQVWRPGHDKRGLGGDQLMMALSSWDLLYDYTGEKAVLDDMQYMADYYLSHSLSASSDAWPDLPYPYNTVVHSGFYDGDMILGKGYLQPDKAGSFGLELVHLYKKTGRVKYLEAAIRIANTLARNIRPGDGNHSPWPFKVHAKSGEPGKLINRPEINKLPADSPFRASQPSVYATNWTPTIRLFGELRTLGKGDTAGYAKAAGIALNWLKAYPAINNRWGPFFEDILGWSDCQINAITYASYLMDHEQADPDWKNTVKSIFGWVHHNLDDREFEKYGVLTTDEQTIYRTPGNSHSSREASAELRYWEKTADTAYVRNAIRELNWATYMVSSQGRNYYIRDDIWLTDGYGDYIRHYLRAMAAAPDLAPDGQDHLLASSTVIQDISYNPSSIAYRGFDRASRERFRLREKPRRVSQDGMPIGEIPATAVLPPDQSGWLWQSLPHGGGVLTIDKRQGSRVEINW